MKNQEIAGALETIADLLEIKGENRFKVNAYRDAGLQVTNLAEDIATIAEEGRLRAVPGVGKDIAARIEEYLATGHIPYLDELTAEIPLSVVEMTRVPGLGPKKAWRLFKELGVSSVAELTQAVKDHRLRGLAGFGAKTEDNLSRELERGAQRGDRHPIGLALPLAEETIAALRQCPAALDISECGSLRRRLDTIGDLDIVVASTEPESVMDAFVALPIVREVILRGPTKTSILTPELMQMDLRVVEPEAFGAAMQYFTGAKAHNVKLREIAIRQGYKLNEYGLFRESDGQRVASRHEDDIYRMLGLDPMPPEMRENLGELDLAARRALPPVLQLADLRGDLHMHTTYSDGHNTLREMALAARERGYEYIAITDHSRSLAVAHGLSVERVLEQRQAIDQLNRDMAPFRIFHSTELEIRADGSLDYDDDILAIFDFVTASCHTGLTQPREKLTARVLNAIRHPRVRIINHLTGRLMSGRAGGDMDVPSILKEASAHNVAMEINSHPERLDLSDQHARQALEAGCRLTLGSDAHDVDGFNVMHYGVSVARRAWARPERVITTWPLASVTEWLMGQ